jgi:predicted RNase H-like HicB family nuclease
MKATATRRAKRIKRVAAAGTPLPLVVEKGEDGWSVIECPVLPGCYTQGKTLDEALRNIREVIELVLEEKNAQAILQAYRPTEISFHTITL